MIKQIVRVWDKPYEISVYQKSKLVWIAVGEYMGGQNRGEGKKRDFRCSQLARSGEIQGKLSSRIPTSFIFDVAA
jgi:hypothetical protein